MERGSTSWILERTTATSDAEGNETARMVVPLYRIVRHLSEATAAALEPHDLTQAEFEVLQSLLLCEKGGHLSLKELNRALLFSSGGMTKIVDRLIAADLVQAEVDTADRRRRLCRLTPAGRKVARCALKDVVAQEKELLENLPQTAKARLATQLFDLAVAIEAARA